MEASWSTRSAFSGFFVVLMLLVEMPLANAGNSITVENAKPGNPVSQWGIHGRIDASGDSSIEGFATDFSVDHGKRVDLKINTDAARYRIDIYRLGYYGGMGARLVASIEKLGASTQPPPLRDLATGLVDAANWAVSASWDMPADAVAGVYIAKLTRLDGILGENQVPFVVRADESHSDILFQTSDTTWQAYNSWGGASLYYGNGPARDGRAYAVSYNRPFTTWSQNTYGEGEADSYLFSGEYPLLSWLEQNGYDVSYVAGMDTARQGQLLCNHKLFISAGHDEYWTAEQQRNIAAARAAGVNLAFFSGNTAFWKARWMQDMGSSHISNRTMVVYKTSQDGAADPSGIWTGTWEDPRANPPHGLPQNALTGQLFRVNAPRADPIEIPYPYSRLRFWRNTTIQTLQPGETAKLPAGYLGFEWDAQVDNGRQPPGLIALSSTTRNVRAYLLDCGDTYGRATAHHSLTLYKAESGALVFGAGTFFWAWGLSGFHSSGAGVPADARVQQATVNLLADMNVQPESLAAGLTGQTASTDTDPPVAEFTGAPDGREAIEGEAVAFTGSAADLGGGEVAKVEISADGGTTWHTADGTANWTYCWKAKGVGRHTFLARAVDDSLNIQRKAASIVINVRNSLFSGLLGRANHLASTLHFRLGACRLPEQDLGACDPNFLKSRWREALMIVRFLLFSTDE